MAWINLFNDFSNFYLILFLPILIFDIQIWQDRTTLKNYGIDSWETWRVTLGRRAIKNKNISLIIFIGLLALSSLFFYFGTSLITQFSRVQIVSLVVITVFSFSIFEYLLNRMICKESQKKTGVLEIVQAERIKLLYRYEIKIEGNDNLFNVSLITYAILKKRIGSKITIIINEGYLGIKYASKFQITTK